MTDAEGDYELLGLGRGHHRVNEVVPVGYRQTFPAATAVTRSTSPAIRQLTGIDFANRASIPPTAVSDPQVTRVDTPVTIDVLANDLEGDNPLDPTTVTIALGPNHGDASVDPVTGAITYTPELGFSGDDELRYTVRDTEDLVSAEAMVNIMVSDVETPWQNQENPLTWITTEVSIRLMCCG